MQADSFIKTPYQRKLLLDYQKKVRSYKRAFEQVEEINSKQFCAMTITSMAIQHLKQDKPILFMKTARENRLALRAGKTLFDLNSAIDLMQKNGIPNTACLEFSRRILDSNCYGSKPILIIS